MYVDLLELVFVGKRTARHVYVMMGVVIYCKYYAVACVADQTADLEKRKGKID